MLHHCKGHSNHRQHYGYKYKGMHNDYSLTNNLSRLPFFTIHTINILVSHKLGRFTRLSRLSLRWISEFRVLSILKLGLVPVGDIASQRFHLLVEVFFWEEEVQSDCNESCDCEA